MMDIYPGVCDELKDTFSFKLEKGYLKVMKYRAALDDIIASVSRTTKINFRHCKSSVLNFVV